MFCGMALTRFWSNLPRSSTPEAPDRNTRYIPPLDSSTGTKLFSQHATSSTQTPSQPQTPLPLLPASKLNWTPNQNQGRSLSPIGSRTGLWIRRRIKHPSTLPSLLLSFYLVARCTLVIVSWPWMCGNVRTSLRIRHVERVVSIPRSPPSSCVFDFTFSWKKCPRISGMVAYVRAWRRRLCDQYAT